MKDHTIWTEKYRCSNIDEYIGEEYLKQFISQCILKNDIPHLLLEGPPGTGKTTLS